MQCRIFWLSLAVLAASRAASAVEPADGTVTPHPVPPEFTAGRNERYSVTVNGKPAAVFHAALNIYFVSFDFTGQAEVKVAAKESDYWQGMAIVRPLSRGIAARTVGLAATFTITRPGQFSVERPGLPQLTVERPGSNRFDDEVLFVFANAPERDVPRADDPHVIWLGPGLHQRNVDLVSGQTLYLAPGAVLFGGINVWDAENVRIRGRGTVVYEGPQSPDYDSGWVHARNWHPLTTHAVRGLTVEGVTFVGRSRTWTLQLCMTTAVSFDNIKVIGAHPSNVNVDGIDWYGGGQATVRDSFFRTADDCFAFLAPLNPAIAYRADVAPWNPAAPTAGPEEPGVVSDITIERCVLWPSRANVIRIGLRGSKALETHHVTMRDCDLLHNQRFIWHAPNSLLCSISTDGKGDASQHDYLFEDIRFEEPMSLIGINVPAGRYRNVRFKDIRFPVGVPSGLLRTKIDGLEFENVRVRDRVATSFADLNLTAEGEATNVRFLSAPK